MQITHKDISKLGPVFGPMNLKTALEWWTTWQVLEGNVNGLCFSRGNGKERTVKSKKKTHLTIYLRLYKSSFDTKIKGCS